MTLSVKYYRLLQRSYVKSMPLGSSVLLINVVLNTVLVNNTKEICEFLPWRRDIVTGLFMWEWKVLEIDVKIFVPLPSIYILSRKDWYVFYNKQTKQKKKEVESTLGIVTVKSLIIDDSTTTSIFEESFLSVFTFFLIVWEGGHVCTPRRK